MYIFIKNAGVTAISGPVPAKSGAGTILEFNILVPAINLVTHSMWPESDPSQRTYNFAPTYFLEADTWYGFELSAQGYETIRGRYTGPAGMKTTKTVSMVPTTTATVKFNIDRGGFPIPAVDVVMTDATGGTQTKTESAAEPYPTFQVEPNAPYAYKVVESGVTLVSGSLVAPALGNTLVQNVYLARATLSFIPHDSPANSAGATNNFGIGDPMTIDDGLGDRQTRVFEGVDPSTGLYKPIVFSVRPSTKYLWGIQMQAGTQSKVEGSAVSGATYSTINVDIAPPPIPDPTTGPEDGLKDLLPWIVVGVVGVGIAIAVGVLAAKSQQQPSAKR